MSEAPAAPVAAAAAAPAEAAPVAPVTSFTAGAETTAPAEGQDTVAPAEGADSVAPAEGQDSLAAAEGGDSLGAPETYEAFTLPDGFELPEAMLESLSALAKAKNMTQAEAQELVNLGVTQAEGIAQRYADLATSKPVVLAQHWAQQWASELQNDKELGGVKLAESVKLGTKVFNTFGTPEFAKFLDETGMAHHPEMHRFMVKVGRAMSEDTLVTDVGGQGRVLGGDPIERAARSTYRNMN